MDNKKQILIIASVVLFVLFISVVTVFLGKSEDKSVKETPLAIKKETAVVIETASEKRPDLPQRDVVNTDAGKDEEDSSMISDTSGIAIVKDSEGGVFLR